MEFKVLARPYPGRWTIQSFVRDSVWFVNAIVRCPPIPRLSLSSFLAWTVKPRFVLIHSKMEIYLLEKSFEKFRSHHGAPLIFFLRLSVSFLKRPHCSAVPVARPQQAGRLGMISPFNRELRWVGSKDTFPFSNNGLCLFFAAPLGHLVRRSISTV